MDTASYLAAIRSNTSALLMDARLGLDPAVPSCPGWDVGDLVIHLGDVFQFWAAIVNARARDQAEVESIYRHLGEERDRRNRTDFSRSTDLFPWFEESAAALEETLARVDPAEQIWTWWPPQQHAGFIQRRMAHETAVHRWDAQYAHGRSQPIEGELARDGIDEIMDIFLPANREDSRLPGAGESYHFHRTDGDGEWLVRFEGDGVAVSREHAKADVAVRGSASELLLFLWSRLPPSRLDVLGDSSLLIRFFQLAPHE